MTFLDTDSYQRDPDALRREVFERAYCHNNGPFERVGNRLMHQFSQLVYLPGDCMRAAAEYISRSRDARHPELKWTIFGNHPGANSSMDQAWNEMANIVESLRSWLADKSPARPNAIFKNLDRLFSDNARDNSVIQHPGTQLALFSLIESTRDALTLGLADSAFGRLPEAVEAAFAETVWLEKIDYERFVTLIPVELAARLLNKTPAKLQSNDRLPEYLSWLLASRLQWTDPIRAVAIMTSMARAPNEEEALKVLANATRPPDFVNVPSARGVQRDRIQRSLAAETYDVVQRNIIEPYKRWSKTNMGEQDQLQQQLKRLPPGMILFGPPGTGKTFIAQWVAQSIGLPIRVVSGADLRSGVFGETERNIVRLFRQARRAMPCVLVLDDADDLLGDRARAEGSLAGAERAIVSTFLQQLAGFDGRLDGVLVILTTNRIEHIDEAIGHRLPLKVPVPYPLNETQIEAIIEAVAEEYGFELDLQVRQALVTRFLEPMLINRHAVPCNTPEERMAARTNRFSPRDIQQAMRLLDDGKSNSDSRYRPTMKNVEQMNAYYKTLSGTPEIMRQMEEVKRQMEKHSS